MRDHLNEQLEHWGNAQASEITGAVREPPESFLHGVRRSRRVRRAKFGAVIGLAIVLLAGASLTVRSPSRSTTAPIDSVAHEPISAPGRFTVVQIARANRGLELDDLRLPEVSLAWTREPPAVW